MSESKLMWVNIKALKELGFKIDPDSVIKKDKHCVWVDLNNFKTIKIN